MALDWGTVPGWVAVVGTVGAFLAAVVIYGVSVRKSRETDPRSKAPLFDAWVSDDEMADYPEHAIGVVTQKLLVTIELSNASGQSVRSRDGFPRNQVLRHISESGGARQKRWYS